MSADLPIAYRADNSPIYDNTPTVVCMLVRAFEDPHYTNLIAIRRKSGLLGLPGGFHMAGETWQQAGSRELLEETGYYADTHDIRQFGETVTDEYGHNMIFAHSWFAAKRLTDETDGEALEVLRLNALLTYEKQWEFPLHYAMAKKWTEMVYDGKL